MTSVIIGSVGGFIVGVLVGVSATVLFACLCIEAGKKERK